MHIIQIASELAPIAKVGGLGDVIYGLSKELIRLGHTVEILLPKYDCIHYDALKNLQIECKEFLCNEGSTSYKNSVWSAEVNDLKVLFIEPHHPKFYFSRGAIYGSPDDIDRFTYFSKAAMEYLHQSKIRPDVLHLHDWPAALAAILHKEVYPELCKGTVFTIHNMEHQGRCDPSHLVRMGVRTEQIQDPYSFQNSNLLKGGIVYSDQITTVSPTYEREIQTPSGGFGLQDTLVQHKKKLRGILNGIDTEFWNPQTDPHLAKTYSANSLIDKRENKRHLRTHLGLSQEDRPLVASVTRLVPQKGPELIKHALKRSVESGAQCILLGSTPIPSLHAEFSLLQEQLKASGHGAILIDKDEALAHLIFAAADLFLIPSLFEPCGLTQLIALRYGAVPIARLTGGLADTVADIDTSTLPPSQRNGFTFDYPDIAGVNWALDRALSCYKREPEKWKELVLRGMQMDFSWKHTAPEYVAVYTAITSK
ncbi:MAG: glycogen synthase [Verrucomicrobia bacterium]|nr:glycogen synthase [Verrucomicrobiota bacterium]